MQNFLFKKVRNWKNDNLYLWNLKSSIPCSQTNTFPRFPPFWGTHHGSVQFGEPTFSSKLSRSNRCETYLHRISIELAKTAVHTDPKWSVIKDRIWTLRTPHLIHRRSRAMASRSEGQSVSLAVIGGGCISADDETWVVCLSVVAIRASLGPEMGAQVVSVNNRKNRLPCWDNFRLKNSNLQVYWLERSEMEMFLFFLT